MYSASWENDATPRGTGVFYEALPAIGADGRNIMKLIPVQMVNGKCVQNAISAPVPLGLKKTFRPIAPRPCAGNEVTVLNALPCQRDVAGQGLYISSNEDPLRTVQPQVFNTPQNQVRKIPDSEVPSGIKRQLPDSFSSSNSVCQSNVSLYSSEFETLGSPNSHLKLIPEVYQRHNSPMKWVIEEVNSNETADDIPHSPFPSKTLATSETHHHQALVVCNDRVFFAAQKNSLSSPLESKGTSCKLKNSMSLLQNKTIIKQNQPNEVIDLCNDDNPDDLCEIFSNGMPGSSPSLDEDNVIFVSYIPPKPECVPAQHLAEKTLGNETHQTSTRTLEYVTEQRATQNVSNTVHDHLPCENGDGSSIDERQTPDQSIRVSLVTNGYRETVTSNQHSKHKKLLDSSEVSPEAESLCHTNASGNNSRESTDKMESSLSICRTSDHHLRQMFGITADVRICLKRINSRSSANGLIEPVQEVPIGDIQKNKNPACHSSLINVIRAKLYDKQNLSREFVSSSPHAGKGLVNCYHLNQNAKCHSCKTPPKTICCVPDTGIMVGYVEPIEDDISNTDEDNTPNSKDLTAQSTNVARPNTSRMGRTRKRTKCPCCVPGMTKKSSAVLEESDRLTWTRNHTSKRGGRRQKFK
ncbi:uncharacterized protein lrif1 isoform X2 [Corythoichthys intestinalis]|uniref:uncharacterized protein lrif1 isoform X2 n=1 Tax=Corythoichthys intestinalis TaxID=161448 RepID=UPI0025A669D7|nr:uncharacterized protein lrif1 isoform X2 [Corythoichthys intestinalis]